MGFWLSIYDESLSLLILLKELVEESFFNLTEKPSLSFLLLMSRACTLAIAVRQLLLHGMEDAARPVVRSFLETLDLALATLTDDQFARLFFESVDDDENYSNVFWNNNIARGRIETRIKRTLQIAGIDEDDQNLLLEFRRNARRTLSQSTHSSIESAFMSFLVPSLVTPGMFEKTIFGHVSIHSPGLLSIMIRAIYLYCFPILILRGAEEPPKALSGEVVSMENDDFAGAIFSALDRILREYEHLFPPPLEFPEG